MLREAERDGEALVHLNFVGHFGAGKTSLISCAAGDEFQDSRYSTIAVEFRTKHSAVGARKVRGVLWDWAGAERFRFQYLRALLTRSGGVGIVFDVSSDADYTAAEHFLCEANTHVDPSIPIVLIAAKCDLLPPSDGAMTPALAVAERLAAERGIPLFRTSAKTGEGVEEAFGYMLRQGLSFKDAAGWRAIAKSIPAHSGGVRLPFGPSSRAPFV